MKKLLSLSLALLCLLLAVPAVLAAGSTYELADLNMTIDAPDDWITFTRDIDPNDPNLALLGLEGNALAGHYTENNVYLNMIRPDPLAEIIVIMAEDESSRGIYDFNSIPESDMQFQAESLMQEMQKLVKDSVIYSDCSIYEHRQAAFVVFHMTQQEGGTALYGKQFTTTINGMVIIIALYSYAGEITDDLSQTLQNTIDSINFTEVKQKLTVFSAFASIAKEIAFVVFIVGLIAFIIKKRKQRNAPKPITGGPVR